MSGISHSPISECIHNTRELLPGVLPLHVQQHVVAATLYRHVQEPVHPRMLQDDCHLLQEEEGGGGGGGGMRH